MAEIITFIIFLAIFLFIGLISNKNKADNKLDYLMAGRDVSPWLVALSAAATKYSGYMFIALIGYIYTNGISSIWILFGFIFGDFIAFYFFLGKTRQQSETTNAMSFADLLSRWHGGNYKIMRVAIGILSLIFLSTYAAAQFSAGGKAIQVLFGWHQSVGIIIGALLILSYCLSGGLRASIWTDAVQAIVMIIALAILLISAIAAAGGITNFIAGIQSVSPNYFDLRVQPFGVVNSIGATGLFALGWLFNGIGICGQPHIMVRFMALDKPQNMRITAIYYFAWSSLFLLLVLAVGLTTRLFLNGGDFDTELALPKLAKMILPSISVGIIMAGIFAAIMSTTDSQILSCSSVLSEDFKWAKSTYSKKVATLAITLISVSISLFASADVFTLVVFAWSALASSLGPQVIVHAMGKRPPEWLVLTMMLTGLLTAILWRSLGWNGIVYEALPGILASLLVFVVGSLFYEQKIQPVISINER